MSLHSRQTLVAESSGPVPSHVGRVLTYAVLLIGAVVSAIPFIYMVMTSLKSYGNIINNMIWPWPPFGSETFQFENYTEAINRIGFDSQWHIPLFVRYFINSLIVAAGTVAGVLVTSITAAYAFARIDLPGKNWIFLLLLVTVMVPQDLVLVPKAVMMFDLNWYNTYYALTIPFTVSVFGIFLLRQFFLQIPRDLYDAAQLDGAGHLRFLSAITLPLSRPALVTVALLHFIWSWDDFKWPLLVTKDANMRLLAVGLQQFMLGEGGTNVHLLMAGATMTVAPVLIFYFLAQKHFTIGVISTGMKG